MTSAISSEAEPLLTEHRPEQLVLPDDPSFLPEFALPPPEFLDELDLDFGLDQPHSGDSQALTSFGSQQSLSSQASAVGGLVLPSSSSVVPGDFQVEGDNGPASVGGRSAMLGADNLVLDLADPDFTFDADGEMVDLPPGNVMSGTPGMPRSSAMLSDAGASARVRREHEEGQQVGVQVSLTILSHVFLNLNSPPACPVGVFPAPHMDYHHECSQSHLGFWFSLFGMIALCLT